MSWDAWKQSDKINFVLKMSKLEFNSLKAYYFILVMI